MTIRQLLQEREDFGKKTEPQSGYGLRFGHKINCFIRRKNESGGSIVGYIQFHVVFNENALNIRVLERYKSPIDIQLLFQVYCYKSRLNHILTVISGSPYLLPL